MFISIVVPVFNEKNCLLELHQQVIQVVNKLGCSFEIIYIDDGSIDNSWQTIEQLVKSSAFVKAIKLRRNFGKTTALNAGFFYAKGDIIITIDADLQHDPVDIPKFLDKINKGYDLVCGWQKNRADTKLKVLASHMFNWLIQKLLGSGLHDINCGMKCYRRNVFNQIQISGEMHRFIVILAEQKGFKVSEVSIASHPRRYGRSKYSSKRYLKGIVDILTVFFLARYRERPQHAMGISGLILLIFAGIIVVIIAIGWLINPQLVSSVPVIALGLLLTILAVMLIMGMNLIVFGLLAVLVSENLVQHNRAENLVSVIEEVKLD